MKISEVLKASTDAAVAKAAAEKAAAAADAALASATSASAAADTEFAKDLQKLGTVVDITAVPPTVYTSPDGKNIHVTQAVSLDADVPPDPVPVANPATNPNAPPAA